MLAKKLRVIDSARGYSDFEKYEKEHLGTSRAIFAQQAPTMCMPRKLNARV